MYLSLYGLYRDANPRHTGSAITILAPTKKAAEKFVTKNTSFRNFIVMELDFRNPSELYLDYVVDNDGNIVLPHHTI